MSSIRMRVLVAGIGLALGVTTAGCGASSSNGGAGGGKDATLRINFPVATTMDPAEVPSAALGLSTQWPVYDRLLQVDKNAKYQPMLATKWEFSGDGKTLTLQLREGVTFTDGSKFDSAVVKANLDRYRKAPATKPLMAMVANVAAPSPTEVKITLVAPTRAVLNSLAINTGQMVSPKLLKEGKITNKAVGTGAWKLEKYTSGQEAVFTRRTDKGGIWDKETGKVAKVEVRSADPSAMANSLRSGQVDVVTSTGNDSAMKNELDSGDLKLVKRPGTMTLSGLYLNPQVKPFDNVMVRQAVNYALDREALVKAFSPHTTPRVQPYPDVLPGFDDGLEKTYTHDVAKAKELLKNAGFPNGVDTGALYAVNFGQIPQMASAVQAQLKEAGIRIKLRPSQPGQITTQYATDKLAGKVSVIPFISIEPGTNFNFLFMNPINLPGGLPPATAKKFGEVDSSVASAQERADRAKAVVKDVTEKAYYAIILQGVPGLIANKNVTGLEQGYLSPYGALDLRNVSMK